MIAQIVKVAHQPLHSSIRVNWEFSSNCDIYHHFWVDATANLLGATENPPKSDDKYVKKVFNWSEVHVSDMTCYKIHTLGYALFLLPGVLNIRCNTIGLSVQTAFFGDLNYPRIPFFVHIIKKDTWFTL